MHNKLYKNSFSIFIDLINKGNYTQIHMCAMHKDCMLHQAYLVFYMLLHAPVCCSCNTCSEHASTCSYNQELQHLFIDKYLQGTTLIPTFKEVMGHYLSHEHNDPIIYQVVGSSPPMISHDLSGLRALPAMPHVLQHISHDPMILDAHNCH